MKAAITRRLDALESGRAPSEPSCVDPVTGELVTLEEIWRFATGEELSVAEICLKADLQEATDPRWGCFDPDLGATICGLFEEARHGIVVLLRARCHNRRTKRRPMPPEYMHGIEPDGLEWLLDAPRAA